MRDGHPLHSNESRDPVPPPKFKRVLRGVASPRPAPKLVQKTKALPVPRSDSEDALLPLAPAKPKIKTVLTFLSEDEDEDEPPPQVQSKTGTVKDSGTAKLPPKHATSKRRQAVTLFDDEDHTQQQTTHHKLAVQGPSTGEDDDMNEVPYPSCSLRSESPLPVLTDEEGSGGTGRPTDTQPEPGPSSTKHGQLSRSNLKRGATTNQTDEDDDIVPTVPRKKKKAPVNSNPPKAPGKRNPTRQKRPNGF
ncbi:hypothetical protein PAXRUDRAFT_16094 [Paxillus rubicundulus Ve08.2h10]|uniref:Uncharacterized protein n=1 Tax=Paxillus rubicundulus Ve08.2h10 TaxID=930991 RepID=A0A0D0DMZ9_9AGAM|nr:hypothetical protein PAXRUDRAFT_16094 [Paxillus rubicundulus Ve08.2h10]